MVNVFRRNTYDNCVYIICPFDCQNVMNDLLNFYIAAGIIALVGALWIVIERRI